MLPTPSTSHVDYNRIYEPAEDSYLLLDTLSSPSETTWFRARFPAPTPPPLVVEIGTGSGVVLAFLSAHARQIFSRKDVATLGVDVNPHACAAAAQTVRLATAEASRSSAAFLDTLVGDLTAPLRARCVDVLVFNPPYVPSEDLPVFPSEGQMAGLDRFAQDAHLLSLSTDGGADGMETTNRLLAELDLVLSERGVAYVLLCAQNKPERIMMDIRAWTSSTFPQGKWCAENVGSSGKTAGWERLCVVRIWRDYSIPPP